MAQLQLRGLKYPVQHNIEKGTYEFPNSDPTKPPIIIDSVRIDRSSDRFDPEKDYVGFIIYLYDGKRNFTLNKINCQAGDIFIRDVDWIERNVRKRNRRGDYYHGRLFYSVFNRWKKMKLGFVGAGFAYHHGKLKFNSGTFNTMNPNNNDNGYHDTNRRLNEFEEQLIQNVYDKLYKNHQWLKTPCINRISIDLLINMPLIIDTNGKLQGTVKSINLKTGYGFIECVYLDKDIFVHYSEVPNRPVRRLFLRKNDEVEFNLIKSDRGWEAHDVVVLNLE